MMPYRTPGRPLASEADAEELRTFAARLRKIEVVPGSRADRVHLAWTTAVRTLGFLLLASFFGQLWWLAASATFLSLVLLVARRRTNPPRVRVDVRREASADHVTSDVVPGEVRPEHDLQDTEEAAWDPRELGR